MKCKFLAFYIGAIAFLGLVNNSLFASGSPETQKVGIKELLEIVEKNNPLLRSSREGLEATHFRVQAAGVWEDPVLSWEEMNIPAGEHDSSLVRERQISISQKIPLFSKKSTLNGLAHTDYKKKEQAAEQKKRDILLQVKNQFVDWYLLHQKLKILEENQTILDHLISVARSQYATGKIPQVDLLNLQIQHAKNEDQRLQLKAEFESVIFDLQRDLNYKLDLLGKSPELPEFHSWVQQLPNKEKIWKQMESSNPTLLMAKEEENNSTLMIQQAKSEFIPEMELMAGYKPMSMNASYIFKVSFPIPLWFSWKQSPNLDAAKVDRVIAEHETYNETLRLKAELSQKLAQWREAQGRVKIYESGLRLWSKQSISLALSGYATGKVTHSTLMESINMNLQTELAYRESIHRLIKTVNSVEALAGPLDGL